MALLSTDFSYRLLFPRTGFEMHPNLVTGGCSGRSILLPIDTCVVLISQVIWNGERFGQRWLAKKKYKVSFDTDPHDIVDRPKSFCYLFVGPQDVKRIKTDEEV